MRGEIMYIDFLFLMCSKNKRSWATHIHNAMKFRVEQTEILRSITLDESESNTTQSSIISTQ